MKEDLKEAHLKAAASEWDAAIEGALQRLRCPEKTVVDLFIRLCTLDDSTRYAVFGCAPDHYEGIRGYAEHSCPSTPLEILQGMAHFVEYDLLDDGSPGIGYLRYDQYDGHVRCDPDHEDAKPYFHRNVDILWQTNPSALALTVERAHEVLSWYENRRRARVLADIDGLRNHDFYDEDDIAPYVMSLLERNMMELIDELVGETEK